MKEKFRFLLIAFDSALESEVQKALKKVKIDHYIKHNGFVGTIRSCKRMDDHTWPGRFMRYLVEVDEDEFKRIRPLLAELSERFCEEGFRTLVIPVEEVI